MQQPEAYFGGVKSVIDEAGEVSAESTRVVLANFMAAFAGWTELIANRKRA